MAVTITNIWLQYDSSIAATKLEDNIKPKRAKLKPKLTALPLEILGYNKKDFTLIYKNYLK